ncbi:MAG: type II secretion system minor pseudopilin GspH [Chromatiales bacterium]|nr:type II secretion system minor pseudopilin GspH [Chromatiales bacterium]
MNRHRAQQGFTLLELLVVVAILGLLYSIVTLSVGLLASDARELERDARRLQALLQSAVEDAVLQGQEFGLRFTPTGYEFSVLDPVTGDWIPWPARELYGPRELGELYRIELEIEGRRVELDDRGRRGARDTYQPQVFILSSDEITPFRVRISRGARDVSTVLEVTDDRRIRIRDDG